MSFYNVKKSFLKLPPVKVLAFARKVIAALQGSEIFTDPNPSVANLTDQAALLEMAIDQSGSKSGIALSIVSAECTNMVAMLSDLADYVSSASFGNKTDILLSGFKPSKQRGKTPLPLPVKRLKSTYTYEPGTVLLNWKQSKYAKHYRVYMSTDPSNSDSWKLVDTCNTRKVMVSQLESGSRCWFKVVAVGSEGYSDSSEVVSIVAA